jgi:hypothetical protein
MHVPRLSRKQTNPSKARLMSNASHLGEAIEHHHNQDSMKKPTKKRPTSGKIKRSRCIFIPRPKRHRCAHLRSKQKQLCSLIANDHADSVHVLA